MMFARNFQICRQLASKQVPKQQLVQGRYGALYRFSTGQENSIDEKTQQLFNELKNKDNLGSGPQRFTNEKTFSNYVIYEHPMNSKEIKTRINLRLLGSSFWFGCGVLVFQFINQYAAFIPLIIMSRSIMSFQVGKKYTKSLINKVVISEDKKSVKLHAVSGDVYETLIEEMDFQGINDLQEAKKDDKALQEDQNSQLSKLKKSSFLAVFDSTDIKGKYRQDLKILFNDQLVNMENAELLTKILKGETDQVLTFQYKAQQAEESKEELSDEKLEEQLEEEIRKRKKQ